MRVKEELYDFGPFGLAIKEARNKLGMTREQAAAIVQIDPRYLTNIENKGQHPSLQIFYKLVTYFNLSVDEFFYTAEIPARSSRRRRLDITLDSLNDKELLIVEATADAVARAKQEPGE